MTQESIVDRFKKYLREEGGSFDFYDYGPPDSRESLLTETQEENIIQIFNNFIKQEITAGNLTLNLNDNKV